MCFTYDLFLNLEGNPPVNHLRCEKLTFNNPTTEFRYKLLMAGGVSAPSMLCAVSSHLHTRLPSVCPDWGCRWLWPLGTLVTGSRCLPHSGLPMGRVGH